MVQRHVLHLGEINDTQELAWRRSIEVLEVAGAVVPDWAALSLVPRRLASRFALNAGAWTCTLMLAGHPGAAKAAIGNSA